MFDGWDRHGQPVGRPRSSKDSFAPWIQFAAVSEDQTANVLVWLFEKLREQTDTVAELGIDLGRTRIYLHGRAGRIEPVTASAGSREGQPVTFAALDQTEAWRRENGGVRLAAVLRRNVGKTGGWTYELQNAPEPGDGSVADRTARAFERGQAGLFFDSVQPSVVPDLHDRSALLLALGEVYGEAVRWVDLERIADECTDVDTDPSDAYRFYLNVERQADERAFDAARWVGLADATRIVADGELVTVGVAGGRFDDALGIVATHIESGHQFVLGCWERPAKPPDGYEHPADEIDGVIVEAFERFDVWRCYVAPAQLGHLLPGWQGVHGEKRVLPWHTSRPKATAYALRGWKLAMTAGDLSNCGDSRMAAHVRNARRQPRPHVLDEDGQPMWTISKEFPASTAWIDLARAGCLSWEARSDAVAAGVLVKPARKARARGF